MRREKEIEIKVLLVLDSKRRDETKKQGEREGECNSEKL
jgi:hypothetical protein